MNNEDQGRRIFFAGATGAAVFAPTCLTSLFFGVKMFFGPDGPAAWWLLITLCALGVSLLHVLCLAVPVLCLLFKYAKVTFARIVMLGFITGVAPTAISYWPYRSDNATIQNYSGGKLVHFVLDGVPTIYGWIYYLQLLGYVGMLGIFSAIAYGLVWKKNVKV